MEVLISEVKNRLERRERVLLVTKSFRFNLVGSVVEWSRPKVCFVTGIIDDKYFDGRMMLGGDRVIFPIEGCRFAEADETVMAH